ncbi:DNA primase large subunit Spp2 [Elasticomyces elasticus]|nr:DNA primase large subunit Spp2 [Elasticomyces elasticus]
MAASTVPLQFSLSFGASTKPNGASRGTVRSVFDNSDDEDESLGRAQEVTIFDSSLGGAVSAVATKPVKEPLVICRPAHYDWRETAKRKRRRNGLPPEAYAQHDDSKFTKEDDIEAAKKQISYGLNLGERQSAEDVHVEDRSVEVQTDRDTPGLSAVPLRLKTEDELAIDALLGRKTDRKLVLPIASEEEAFRQDFANAPEPATLDDYAAVPVEEFGAALLRGMGWKDGDGIGKNAGRAKQTAKKVVRRPAQLGLGAKADASITDDLAAFGKGAKNGRKEKTYNPVVMRNAKTGEVISETEMKQRLEKQKEEDVKGTWKAVKTLADGSDRAIRSIEAPASRHGRRHDDEYDERDAKRRRRERDKYNDSRRRSSHHKRSYIPEDKHRSSYRNRSHSPDDYRQSRSERDRREKERSRRDRDVDYDRDRDRAHDDRRDRERYRESDRYRR